MMEMSDSQENILFNVTYGDFEVSFQLSQSDTVGNLKKKIYETMEIPPSKQIVECWYKYPEDDDDTLGKCCESDTNYLVVYNSDYLIDEPKKVLVASAPNDFIEYFSNSFNDGQILFDVCDLGEVIQQTCFGSLESRKFLLLYLHKKEDSFAKFFVENLVRPEVKKVINDRFFLLGWDIEQQEYHKALSEALISQSELANLASFIESKICAALILVPIKNSFTIFSCMSCMMDGTISRKYFLKTLKKTNEFFLSVNHIDGSTDYQQLMLDSLGDRDYDSFDYFEFDRLKEKIGFALYGPPKISEKERKKIEDSSPKKLEGYEEKENEKIDSGPPKILERYEERQKKKIEELFKIIVKQNNMFAKWKDRVIISFIYNCMEPLVIEKKKQSKKDSHYNPYTDLAPTPLFVLRKCKNSENPCRVIIDDSGRVYKTWQAYLSENKLPECKMVLPKNGRYQADENGKVLLERHLSPACGIDTKILQGTDVASAATGIVSGSIFLAAAIPAITVAPVALVAAAVTGVGVGLYSIGRSAYTLVDRSMHEETLSFANSEARGAYLNIVAGSLGLLGAGANTAVSQLAARGFNIGQGATAAVNGINVVNISASGISVVNSGYDVFNQCWNENQKPSLLTIVQLSSSILFFSHAVYNFRMVGTMIEESQTKTVRDYRETLRSNRHRKTFNKLMKETIRQNDGNVQRGRAEVIKTIRQIQNKDDVFATLTRLNKQMNKNNVRFSASNGGITLNGISIDMAKFGVMNNNEAATFLATLPNTPKPSQNDTRVMNLRLLDAFRGINRQEIARLAMGLLKIFSNTEESIKEKIINAVAAIVMKLLGDSPGCYRELDNMFPGWDKLMRLFTMVSGYFQVLIDQVEKQYRKWFATKDSYYEKPIFFDLALEYSARVIQIFDFVSKGYFIGNNLTEAGLKKLIDYFYTWFTKQVCDFSASKDVITLDGVSIDTAKCEAMNDNEAATFLATLSNSPEPSQNDIRVMHSRLLVSFRGVNPEEIAGLAMGLLKIFSNTEKSIKEKIINAVAAIVMKLLGDSPHYYRKLENMFLGIDKLMRLFSMVCGYFQMIINQVEKQYLKWFATRDPDNEKPIFLRLSVEYSARAIQIFNFVSRIYFIENDLTDAGLKELITYFYTWFAKQEYELEQVSQRRKKRIEHNGPPARQVFCSVCRGFTYEGFS